MATRTPTYIAHTNVDARFPVAVLRHVAVATATLGHKFLVPRGQLDDERSKSLRRVAEDSLSRRRMAALLDAGGDITACLDGTFDGTFDRTFDRTFDWNNR